MSDENRGAEANLHEIGMVKGLVEKQKSKETILDERVWGSSDVQIDKSMDMQGENDTVKKDEPKFNFKVAPKELAGCNDESPKVGLGPVAMSFDPSDGWVVEKLGPNSRHWKRLAREGKSSGPVTAGSPRRQKRRGPTPLQELDPNALSQKKRKGKATLNEVSEQYNQRDGGVAAAAMQPR